MTLPLDHGHPVFDIGDIPFSTSGAWFNLSTVLAAGSVSDDVHLVSHQTGMHPVLRLTPLVGGAVADTTITATPSQLIWHHDRGVVRAAFESPSTLRLRGEGLSLLIAATAESLTSFTGTYLFRDSANGGYVFTSYETGRRYRITPLGSTTVTVEGDQSLGKCRRTLVVSADDGPWEAAVEEFGSGRSPYRAVHSFDKVARAAQAAFSSFVESAAPWRSQETKAAELACYVLWSATVSPAGFLKRPAILMSKHWMDKVWSWDHCFNALALARADPRLAWDQFMIPFDHQDPSGALPDSVAHSEVLYNYVKPPIHGWALKLLWPDVHAAIGDAELAAGIDAVEAWTEYWLRHRTAEGSGLPHYHHGNDSGWDNATSFDRERAIESPDAAALLSTQMRALSTLHLLNGNADRGELWEHRATVLEERLVAQLWVDGSFRARGVASGIQQESRSLLDLLPIVLGDRLPASISAALVSRLQCHLTRYGLATEQPDSPHYQADGYWRGPIWAPASILVEFGLREVGEASFADDLAQRFMRLCEAHGFAENFDAMTGEGLRDRAYTWTASAYLLFARALFERPRG